MISITGKQRRELEDALCSAFPSWNELKRMVAYVIGRDLEKIAPREGLSTVVFELVNWSQSRGLLGALLEGAYKENPGNDQLATIYREFLIQIYSSPGDTDRTPATLEKRHAGTTPDGDITWSSTPLPPIKNRWALLVGINTYTDPAFGKLKYCVNDVKDLKVTLEKLGYCVVALHDEQEPYRQPTLTNIKAELQNLLKTAEPEDLVWVHFACHGQLVETEAYMITADSRSPNLFESALSFKVLEKQLRSKIRRLVITLDACHGGVELGRGPDDQEFVRTVFEQAEGFALLAASTKQQAALEHETLNNGIFSHFLIEGLSGRADLSNKGFVTVDDLRNYVLASVKQWTYLNGYTAQEPTARTEGLGDMILGDYRDF